MLGGKGPATWRAAGLDEGWAALWRRHRIQWAAAFEKFAMEIDRVDLRVIGVDAAIAVHDHCVRLPAIEKLVDEVHVLVCHRIPRLARRQLIEAEILLSDVFAAGNDVPTEPAAGDVVDGRRYPCQHEGRPGHR